MKNYGRRRLRQVLFCAFSTPFCEKSIKATTLTQRLMMCAATLFSRNLLMARLPPAQARRKDTREGKKLQRISRRRWLLPHILTVSSESGHGVTLTCKGGRALRASATGRLNMRRTAAAAGFKRQHVWRSCVKG
jgi:hypothetical protein